MLLFPLSILNRSKPYWPVLVLTLSLSAIELPVKAQSQELMSVPEIAQATDAARNEALKKKAANAVNLLASGKYEELRKIMAPPLAQSLTAQKIKDIWDKSEQATGKITKQLNAEVVNTVNADLVVVNTQFAKTTDNIVVTFNKNQQIVGIDFPKIDSIEQISQIFVESMAANNYTKARGYLHPFLKTELFPQQVQKRWEDLIRRNGAFKKIVKTEIRPGSNVDRTDLVIVTAEFDKGSEPLFIIFDEERRIVGVDAPRIN
ncbi:DUF3887 domain-containing protein [Gloeothece verrucosa]|uniref:DUF3887 domain-containing protein n=1 Tax=Gloeothece verrucosa (strain PCC 7822) TaxID=497965 RepID=E0U6I2_GLOV7|nr:DUF3887 domain-containing protein [Gloeothece verrucosa]ADN13625.1 conserved hypothetical protein [Gloeothece verrucosa PCC 7822]